MTNTRFLRLLTHGCLLVCLALFGQTAAQSQPPAKGTPGTIKWTFQADERLCNIPVIGANGAVIVAAMSGCVYSLRQADGGLLAQTRLQEDYLRNQAVAADGTVYVLTSARLYALTPAGATKWVQPLPYTGDCLFPAIGKDGTIYVGAGRFLYALRPDSGSTKWRAQLAPATYFVATPAIAEDGTIFVTAANDLLYALYPGNGSIKWTLSLYRCGNTIALGADGTVYVTNQDELLAVDPANGAINWACEISYSPSTSGLVTGPDGTVYVKTTKLHAIQAGSVLWAVTVGSGLHTPTVGAGGTLYTCDNDGMLYAVAATNGGIRWTCQTGGELIGSPTIGPDGTLFIGCRDHHVYAVYSASPGPAASSWPMVHHDVRFGGRCAGSGPVYRLLNIRSGIHFYTNSSAERDSLLGNSDYCYEGAKFNVHDGPGAPANPCFRFFNTRNGSHFFTVCAAERDDLLAHLPHYRFEGVGFYAYKQAQSGTIPVYRFFNTRTGAHFYTVSRAERDYVLCHLPHYQFEGVPFYVFPL